MRRAAMAAVGKKMRVALVYSYTESVANMLRRLDTAFGQALTENRDPHL